MMESLLIRMVDADDDADVDAGDVVAADGDDDADAAAHKADGASSCRF